MADSLQHHDPQRLPAAARKGQGSKTTSQSTAREVAAIVVTVPSLASEQAAAVCGLPAAADEGGGEEGGITDLFSERIKPMTRVTNAYDMDGCPIPYVEGDTTGEPDEGRCKTCKWWSEPHTSPMLVQRECLNKEKLGEGVSRVGLDVLLAEPSEHDDITLYVGPDFGCWHHEPKSDESERNTT